MLILIAYWFLSALCLMVVAHVVPGFELKGFGTALIAAVVIGLINATIGLVLKIVTLPFTIITLGFFLFVINALMLRFSALFVSGFVVKGFLPAFLGAVLLAILNTALRHLVFKY